MNKKVPLRDEFHSYKSAQERKERTQLGRSKAHMREN